jgi:hypothetical protein
VAFGLRKFLAHLTAGTLERHFKARHPQIAASVGWADPLDRLRAALERAILACPVGSCDPFPLLERVHLLSDVPGDRAMVAACGPNEGLVETLRALDNAYERALWLLDRGDRLFERAEEIRYTDLYAGAGRRWTGFVGPRVRWPELEAGRLERFQARLEVTFQRFDGSGSTITVEPFERGPTSPGRHGEGRVFQLAVYLEGLPQTSTEFHDGKLVRRGMRPALELALTYAPDTGSIDVVAHAGKELRTEVAHAFVEELFPAEATLEPIRLRQFDLSRLASAITFPTAPEDGIRSVRLASLRLSPDGCPGRVTLELDKDPSRTLHEAAREWFGPYDPLPRAARITKAKLVIRFEPRPGQRRGRSVPVELCEPHGCNLRDRSDQERLICDKYLRLWGLVRDA